MAVIKAPSGGIIESLPEVGALIKKGETLYVIEIMKTLYPIKAESDTRVALIHVEVQDVITKGQDIMEVHN